MDPVLSLSLDLSGASGHLGSALHQQLREAILDGRIAAGTPLPSSRALAAELGISRNTVTSAYDLLVAEGYVLPRDRARPVVGRLHARAARRKTQPATNTPDPRLAPTWRFPYPAPTAMATLPERSFRLGVPDHRYFPHALWRQLMARALRGFARRPFSYPPSEGLPELRAAIASHVAFTRAVACDADAVLVTSGAQQACDMLARLLVTPGRTRVAVEDPGYPPIRATFAAAGARVEPAPVDNEGLRVDALPDGIDIIVVTPSHQSPTGVAMSLARRTALLGYARRHNAVLVEDDYDGEFRFGGRPLDALQTLDCDGSVFYVGTFSKSLFPALRKGFVVSPAWARGPMARLKATCDAHCDAVVQDALAGFLRDGHMARHVRRMRSIYAARRLALLEGLARLDTWLEVIPSEAGMHMAARLRDPASARHFFAALHEHAPGAQSVADYAVKKRKPAVVFGYGAIDAGPIRERLAALRRTLGPRP